MPSRCTDKHSVTAFGRFGQKLTVIVGLRPPPPRWSPDRSGCTDVSHPTRPLPFVKPHGSPSVRSE